ncbi:Fer-1-Like Protein 5 [Manis pentadactyla]|nr:Fer-1-Like Protein 5 [Manis pentadactyla]
MDHVYSSQEVTHAYPTIQPASAQTPDRVIPPVVGYAKVVILISFPQNRGGSRTDLNPPNLDFCYCR